MPVKRESRSGKLVWGLPPKTVYANCCLANPDCLANRDLDATGRIRVVSDQNSVGNLLSSYGSDSVWKPYSKQKHEKRKSQVLTKLCSLFVPVQLFMAPLIARQTSFAPRPVTEE